MVTIDFIEDVLKFNSFNQIESFYEGECDLNNYMLECMDKYRTHFEYSILKNNADYVSIELIRNRWELIESFEDIRVVYNYDYDLFQKDIYIVFIIFFGLIKVEYAKVKVDNLEEVSLNRKEALQAISGVLMYARSVGYTLKKLNLSKFNIDNPPTFITLLSIYGKDYGYLKTLVDDIFRACYLLKKYDEVSRHFLSSFEKFDSGVNLRNELEHLSRTTSFIGKMDFIISNNQDIGDILRQRVKIPKDYDYLSENLYNKLLSEAEMVYGEVCNHLWIYKEAKVDLGHDY